jgi:tRNA(Ile)-lysidine synthase
MDIPLLIPGSKAILGFSGGVDSVVLSHFLIERYRIRPYLLHVNYGLREEADEDERWCRWYAEEHRFEIAVLKANAKTRNGQNVQNWARDIRYDFFREQAELIGAKYIFTAHHADDRRETFLMNALRGSGLTTMAGMSNSQILRPLAHMDKSEVLEYAQQHGLNWVEDSSNATLKYKRNKMRHLLFPVLDEVEPRWRGGLKKSIDNLSRDSKLLDGLLLRWSMEHVKEIDGELYIQMGTWSSEEYAQVLLYRFARRLDAGFSFQEIGHVLSGDSGQRTLGKSHLLIKDRGQFIIGPIHPIDDKKYEVKNIHDTSHLPFDLRFIPKAIEEVKFQNDQEWISTSIPFPLIIRVWKPGDKFIPLGMNGQKKIADFLNDLRVPRHHKERVYVAEHQGQILWVLGYRIDDSLKVATGAEMAYLAEINPRL